MAQRRRYMTREEIAAQISATRDITLEQVDEVFDELVEMGVPIDTLVKFTVTED